jgi:CheY-like chemotaxis protein
LALLAVARRRKDFWRIRIGSPEDLTPDYQTYAGRRFLLIDDDPPALAAQGELLERMGAQVILVEVRRNAFAQAVEEACRHLTDARFGLVLIDNNLPGRDLGQRMVQRIRQRLGEAPLPPFLLLTANAIGPLSESAIEELRGLGVVGFIQRPFSHRALRRLLEGEEKWDQGAKGAPSGMVPGVAEPSAQGLRPLLKAMQQQEELSFVALLPAQRGWPRGSCW